MPATNVQEVKTKLPWDVSGAMPEMLQTTYGSLFRSLRLQEGKRLLIRGGTTSVGLAAAGLAKVHGAHVTSTSRGLEKFQLMKDNGAEECLVDDGNLAVQVKRTFDKCLELIGIATLEDSLNCVKEGGIVCQTGIVWNRWSLQNVDPMELIPSAVCLTTYSGNEQDFARTPLDEMAQ